MSKSARMSTPKHTHYRIPAATVADHAEAHDKSPEELGDVPCGATDGEFTDDYDKVNCPECCAAGFGPVP